MRILILGGDGMLGHQLLASLQARHQVKATLRRSLEAYGGGRFTSDNAYGNVDVRDTDRLLDVMADQRPQAVVNCVGLIKQRDNADDRLAALEINAVFPHRLRTICAAAGARLIQLGTDCVFSGRQGKYTEQSAADAEDVYGRTKWLGELHEPPALTLRTSIIGLELSRRQSLIEWFLAQSGVIRGFRRAIYTGVTTLELARIVEHVLQHHPDMTGLWHVTSTPVSKYQLLTRLAALLQRTDLQIQPDDSFHCDRSLDGAAFARRTGYQVADWETMLNELARQIQQRGVPDVAA